MAMASNLINRARVLVSRRILRLFPLHQATILNHYSSLSNPFQRDTGLCTPTVCDNSFPPTNHSQRVEIPTLIPSTGNHLEGISIQLVDSDIWPQTLVEASEPLKEAQVFDEMTGRNSGPESFPDFDEIEDLRLHKKLFYKLDRGSKEFEEYSVNFHRKKSLKKSQEKTTKAEVKQECKKPEKATKAEVKKESKRFENLASEKPINVGGEKLTVEAKRVRTPTFNQLTGPYHLPFCLDIFITKGSVRASIIHRVTSRVVAVAHSISKDLKFDLSSRKDAKACAAVGGVLAQRAIEDDIHNVVYTPRKGDKIEGKLQVVLQSIIDNGIDVKVKLKQRRHVKRTQM